MLGQPETNKPIDTGSNEQERADALICQITDGFVRGDEKRTDKDTRPFGELLTNLLPRAGVFARSVVSQKLCARTDVPRSVIELMLDDDAAVVEPLAIHSPLLSDDDITKLINRRDPILRQALFKRESLSIVQRQSILLDMPVRIRTIKPATLQAAAKAAALPLSQPQHIEIKIPEQPAIIEAVAENRPAPTPVETIQVQTPAQPQVSQLLDSLVRAAVLRRHEDLAKIIGGKAGLSTFIALTLLKDTSGEALMAACHHIGVPEEVAMQVATLLYPSVLRTHEQITGLRKLFRNFTPVATARIVNAWRALPQHSQAKHETVHAGTAKTAATTTTQPTPAAQPQKTASNQ